MKVLAINGSPRKDRNTATLLQHALDGAKSVGAETEMIHLIDYKYSGCVSCFACKRKGTEFIGKCAVQDELTPILEKAMRSKAMFMGSPIYLGDVTSLMRAFMERLIFMNISYDNPTYSSFEGSIPTAFIYTMNVPGHASNLFEYVYRMNSSVLQTLKGTSDYFISGDTCQFDDYSQYSAGLFSEEHKLKVRAEQFPKDCKQVFEMGVDLGKE
jgi:multimeric flavodoxin WrbA